LPARTPSPQPGPIMITLTNQRSTVSHDSSAALPQQGNCYDATDKWGQTGKAMLRALVVATILIAGCASQRLVYSNGFSFANYDFLVVGKPGGDNPSTTLYGMDIEFANVMSRYNMKVIGDREFAEFPPEMKKRTLFARMSMSAGDKHIQLTVSFDDAVTNKTVSSITSENRGNIFDNGDRDKVFASATKVITNALQHEKGLTVTDIPNQR
jgi:hypothetical protein